VHRVARDVEAPCHVHRLGLAAVLADAFFVAEGGFVVFWTTSRLGIGGKLLWIPVACLGILLGGGGVSRRPEPVQGGPVLGRLR